jgi:hypothetical protein
MNFKQEQDGTINVTFKPEEIATLVRVVKSSEEARIAGLKESAKEILKEVKEAEKELVPPQDV